MQIRHWRVRATLMWALLALVFALWEYACRWWTKGMTGRAFAEPPANGDPPPPRRQPPPLVSRQISQRRTLIAPRKSRPFLQRHAFRQR